MNILRRKEVEYLENNIKFFKERIEKWDGRFFVFLQEQVDELSPTSGKRVLSLVNQCEEINQWHSMWKTGYKDKRVSQSEVTYILSKMSELRSNFDSFHEESLIIEEIAVCCEEGASITPLANYLKYLNIGTIV